MATIRKDAKVQIDAYIAEMSDFAREICNRLRSIIHQADPEIEEDWKWGPNFNKNGMICGFWPTKTYVKFTFYRGAELEDKHPIFNHCTDNENNRSIKYSEAGEINKKEITACIKAAVKINKSGPRKINRNKTISIPEDLKKLLKQNKTAQNTFDTFPYYCKKEYIEWIDSAKKQETREKRLNATIEKLEKKSKLNDRYRQN